MEELQGGMKKKAKPPPRLTELEELVARHKEHVVRLEKVLRCIDNETIQPEELENLKGDMEMYLVSSEC
jgi:CCR4-NOT transcription complex subunit 3